MQSLARRLRKAGWTGAALLLCGAGNPGYLPPPGDDPALVTAATDPLANALSKTDGLAALAEAVAAALEYSPAVGSAHAAVLEETANRQIARASRRPRLSILLEAQQALARGFSNDPDNLLERARPSERADATLSLEHMLFDGGDARNRDKAAGARMEAAEANALRTEQSTALAVTVASYELIHARTVLAIATSGLDRRKSLAKTAHERLAGGTGTVGDVARAEAALAEAGLRQIGASEAVVLAEQDYRLLSGLTPPPTLLRSVPPAKIDLRSLADAAALRDDVRAAESTTDAARHEVAATAAECRARLRLRLDATKYDVFADSIDHDVRASVTLSQPIYAGGSCGGRADLARARLARARLRLAEVRDLAGRDAETGWERARRADERVGATEAAYLARRRARDALATQYRMTRGSLIDLISAEDALVAAAEAHVAAVLQADLAKFRLLADSGGLLAALGLAERR